MNITDELRQTVALSLAKDVGPVAFKNLLGVFGNVAGIFKASPAALKKVKGVSKILPSELKDASLLKKADAEIEKAQKQNVKILTFFDEDYPGELREIYAPPIVLYVKGSLPARDVPKIAVVGSRHASFYGQKMAKEISGELALAGVAVVSGLALGIDSAAHEGALSVGGITVAVLGGGMNKLYPAQNKKMAEAVLNKGALISEYPLDMVPRPQYFPVRNRIISGISRAVLVVEAREKSGALITVDAALEQGKDVFAVPGNADSLKSAGSNSLLKQGAQFITRAEDILEELHIKRPNLTQKKNPCLTEEENRLLSLWDGSEPLHVDSLIEQSNVPQGQLMSALLTLEMKGLLKQLPGKNFVKL